MRKQIVVVKKLIFICLILIGTKAMAQDPIIINNESDINSAFQEYSPAFFSNGLVFVASNPSVKTSKKEDNETGKTTTSIFFVTKGDKGNLQNPIVFADELTTKYYDGPLSFSADGNTIYFTRSNLKKGKPVKSKDGSVKLKIYTALKINNKWENISELPFNGADFDCAHPSVSHDGRRLYFASNRPEGFGGWDIYVSTLINGKWSDPVNLGPKVNTPKNEVFPFIHLDGKVYFSSNGRQGIGNLDIFYTQKTDTGWLKPHLLPEPINSRSDDFGLIVSSDKKSGYFSSNRASGKGDDDIFSFHSPNEIDLMIQLTDTEEMVEATPVPPSISENVVETKPFSEVMKPTVSANSSEFSESTNKVEAIIAVQPQPKKEDSAIPTPEVQKIVKEEPKAEVITAVQPQPKKEDSAIRITEVQKVVKEEPKADVIAIVQLDAKKEVKAETTYLNEPIFDETNVAITPSNIEIPSDKPLKKLSEPKVELSKTEFADTEVLATIDKKNENPDKPITQTEKLVDSSIQSLISPPKPIISRSSIKSEKLDEHNAALIIKADKSDLNKGLATSSQIKSKYLVVVGTYSIPENAIIQKKIAVKKGFTDTEIIKYEDNNLYGVCVRHFNDEKDAQSLARTIHKDLKMDAFVKVLK